ncbi:MAG: ABC transporter permease [Candidatus Andersenbacteria bacterium]
MLTDITTIWRRELLKFFADPSHVVINLLSPIIIIFLVGLSLNDVVKLPGVGSGYFGFFGPGLIAVAAIGSSMQVGFSLIRDREGAIGNVLVAPITRSSILLGKMLAELTEQGVTFLLALVIFLVANHVALYGALISIPIVGLIVLGFSSIGIVAASIFYSTKAYNSFLTFVVSPLIFVSGAFFPLQDVPSALQYLSMVNPLTYGVDAVRTSVFSAGTFGLPTDLAVLVPFALGSFALALWLFSRREVKLW